MLTSLTKTALQSNCPKETYEIWSKLKKEAKSGQKTCSLSFLGTKEQLQDICMTLKEREPSLNWNYFDGYFISASKTYVYPHVEFTWFHPLSWSELTKYNNNAPLNVLERDPAIQKKYDDHQRSLKDSGSSVDGHILSLLGSQYNRSLCRGRDDYVYATLMKNDFPYYLEGNISHYLLWTSEEVNYEAASKIMKTMSRDDKADVIMFANNKDNRSIKIVPHYHVFSRGNLNFMECLLFSREYLNN